MTVTCMGGPYIYNDPEVLRALFPVTTDIHPGPVSMLSADTGPNMDRTSQTPFLEDSGRIHLIISLWAAELFLVFGGGVLL